MGRRYERGSQVDPLGDVCWKNVCILNDPSKMMDFWKLLQINRSEPFERNGEKFVRVSYIIYLKQMG